MRTVESQARAELKLKEDVGNLLAEWGDPSFYEHIIQAINETVKEMRDATEEPEEKLIKSILASLAAALDSSQKIAEIYRRAYWKYYQ